MGLKFIAFVYTVQEIRIVEVITANMLSCTRFSGLSVCVLVFAAGSTRQGLRIRSTGLFVTIAIPQLYFSDSQKITITCVYCSITCRAETMTLLLQKE